MSTKKQKKRRKHTKKTKLQHKSSVVLVSVVLLFMGIVLSVASVNLYKKNEASKIEEEATQKQIDEEKERKEEIDELDEYAEDDEYIKDVAKDKCGLREEDEVLIKPKK